MRASLRANRRWACELGVALSQQLARQHAAASTLVAHCRGAIARRYAIAVRAAAVAVQRRARGKLVRARLRTAAARRQAASRLQAAARGAAARAVLSELGAQAREHVEALRRLTQDVRRQTLLPPCQRGVVAKHAAFAPPPPRLPSRRSFDVALPPAQAVLRMVCCMRYAVGDRVKPCVEPGCQVAGRLGIWTSCVCC